MKEIAEALTEAQTLIEKIHIAFADSQGDISIHKLRKTLSVVNSVLAKPLRNCDVGNADEQAKRFEEFCLKHIGCAKATGGRHCAGCPLEKASRNITQKCELYWGQMIFEEGANDEQ